STLNEIQPNSSEDSIFFLEIVFVSFMLPTILGLGGNGIVLWFLCFKIKRNEFTVYVLNLAIADFTFIFSCFVTFLLILMNLQSPVLEKYFSLVVDIIFYFGYNTSFFLLTAIGAERCLSILFPVWCQCNRPKHLSAYVCAFLWTLSCLITIFSCVLNFLIFTPIMVLSSLILFITVQRRPPQQRHQTRLYITIMVTVMVFLVFAMPVRLTNIVKYWLPELVSARLVYISVLLNIINSSANPLVYFCVREQKQSRLGRKPRSLGSNRSCQL
uniref:G-protein coupled receptors family 1 profile domain-containing protein n=1 Tax=Apteryx owenii TaxID=8824 RepID=A0A8B9Q9W6_APTOW